MHRRWKLSSTRFRRPVPPIGFSGPWAAASFSTRFSFPMNPQNPLNERPTDAGPPLNDGSKGSSGMGAPTGRRRRIPGLGWRRLVLAGVLSWLIRGAAAAGTLGILLGPAETFRGKTGDFVMAAPNAYRGLVHYLHADQHVDQFARTVEYLDQHAPTVEEVQTAVEDARTWIRRFEFSRARLRRGALRLGLVNPIGGIADIREGLDSLPPRGSMDVLLEQSSAMLDPAAAYLAEVKVDPIVQGARNLGDNLAPDEILATLAAIALLAGSLLLMGLYIVTMWVRRGLPGFLGRLWLRAGVRFNRRWYAENRDAVIELLGLGPPGD